MLKEKDSTVDVGSVNNNSRMQHITYTKEDFAWTRWDAKDFTKASEAAIAQSQRIVQEIIATSKDERTFDNTVFALQMAIVAIKETLNKIELLLNVSPDADTRDSAKEQVKKMQGALIEIEFEEPLYRAVKDYSEKNERLTTEDQRLLEDFLRDYRRKGFEKQKEIREQVKVNFKKLQELGLEFDKSLNECKDFIIISPEETQGLSENYLQGLQKDKNGNYIVTLKYPDYFPFVENSANAEKRKTIVDKFFQRGGEHNIRLLQKMLEIRTQNSTLLGYETHAHFVLEEKMAKTPDTVKRFLEKLASDLQAPLKKDIADLTQAKRDETGGKDTTLKYYDTAYYSNQLRKQRYSLDKEKVREYFPLDKTLTGMFKIYGALLSIRFVEMTDIKAWHKEAKLYRIENLDGSLVSYFFLDPHPREGKYGHAAKFGILVGHKNSPQTDKYQTPLAVMVANFTSPVNDKPSLLAHEEVETLFHEFGHVLHHNLTTAKNYFQAGTHTSRDFVEAPSQMLEHWVWNKDMLKTLSSHYKTGEIMPDELIDTILAAQNHMSGHFYMRQLVLAMFDFRLHTEDQSSRIIELYTDLVNNFIGIGLTPDHRWPAGFAHIAGHGYDVGYYGYLWSKVYGDDMFSRFGEKDILDAGIGLEYRQKILEVGSSRDEMESIKDFLGREPNNKAFLEDLGIKVGE